MGNESMHKVTLRPGAEIDGQIFRGGAIEVPESALLALARDGYLKGRNPLKEASRPLVVKPDADPNATEPDE